jgi:hypothetical protein
MKIDLLISYNIIFRFFKNLIRINFNLVKAFVLIIGVVKIIVQIKVHLK